MKLARVAGTVVSTIQAPALNGRKLLLCDLLRLDGKPEGVSVIAVDTVDAGEGEVVLLLDEGNSARQVLGVSPAPVRTLVVGVVDEFVVEGRRVSF
jgi:ethanolamine utilization protein EutN